MSDPASPSPSSSPVPAPGDDGSVLPWWEDPAYLAIEAWWHDPANNPLPPGTDMSGVYPVAHAEMMVELWSSWEHFDVDPRPEEWVAADLVDTEWIRLSTLPDGEAVPLDGGEVTLAEGAAYEFRLKLVPPGALGCLRCEQRLHDAVAANTEVRAELAQVADADGNIAKLGTTPLGAPHVSGLEVWTRFTAPGPGRYAVGIVAYLDESVGKDYLLAQVDDLTVRATSDGRP